MNNRIIGVVAKLREFIVAERQATQTLSNLSDRRAELIALQKERCSLATAFTAQPEALFAVNKKLSDLEVAIGLIVDDVLPKQRKALAKTEVALGQILRAEFGMDL
jgi:hypothetical protein